MIQRAQTLWLLLSVITAGLSFIFPFATGWTLPPGGTPIKVQVDAGYQLYLTVLTFLLIALGMVTIFLFRNRSKQQWYCLLGLLLTTLLGALYVRVLLYELNEFIPSLTALLPIGQWIGYLMAWRGIRHDEKLLKDQDTLR
jgi:heme/copper-type cytochrome/quinol oxidase subunit 3